MRRLIKFPGLMDQSITRSAVRFKNTQAVYTQESDWQLAQPFAQMPGPSRIELVKENFSGGRFYQKDSMDVQKMLRSKYGDIYLLPGTFGKRDRVVTFNPEDFEKVFRTEGMWPIRRVMDAFDYYRKDKRKDVFQVGGLNAEQGPAWGNFRSKVNPAMMQPRAAKFYIPKMNKISDEFVERIKAIRNESMEMPRNFENEISRWALESVVLVALDTELGLISRRGKREDAEKLIDEVRVIFNLSFELDLKPSLWKILPTPKYSRMIRALDTLTEVSTKLIEESAARLKERNSKDESDKSVFEKIVEIDQQVAIVMAMDFMLAGVDTTTSALTGCLLCLAKNPKKQEKLREEILRILPEKSSPLTEANMKNLPYLRAVIKESIRLYPPATGNFRETGQDLALSGFQVPKGTAVYMPSQILMREDFYYPQASDFIPERWLRSNSADTIHASATNPFVYLPFGFGPRMCIGKRMVELELEIILSKIVRNFKIRYDHPAENVFRTYFISIPVVPLKFKFTDVEGEKLRS